MADWQSFWATQRTPLHRRDEQDFYARHAAELALLTGSPAGRRVLEIGCGDGALFEPLGFVACERYLGVDLSPTMLDAFRGRGHSVELRLGDAIDIPCDEHFDLVFSNGVAQYLDQRAFVSHLEAVSRRLAPGGKYVCGSIPAGERRAAYVSGAAAYPPRRDLARTAKEVAQWIAGRSSLGTWFGLGDLHDAASAANFEAEVYGSLCYLYRYHAVFTKP